MRKWLARRVPTNKAAIEYLTFLQRTLGGEDYNNPFQERQFVEAVLASVIAERHGMDALSDPEIQRTYAQTLEMATGPALTPYESPAFTRMVNRYADLIENVASTRLELPPRPVIGSLPTDSTGVCTALVPGGAGGYVIAFDGGFLGFTSHLTEIVAQTFLIVPDREWFQFSMAPTAIAERLQVDGSIRETFIDVVMSYAVDRRAGSKRSPARNEPGRVGLKYRMLESLQLFVLAHELSHTYLGHIGTADVVKGILPIDEAETVSYSWTQEFAADRLGGVFSVDACRLQGSDIALGYCGADLYFTMLDVLDKTVALLETGDEDNRLLTSHPAALLRRKVLRATVEQAAEGDIEAYGQNPLGVAEALESAVDQLWLEVRPIVLQAAQSGVRAHPSWMVGAKAWQGLSPELLQPGHDWVKPHLADTMSVAVKTRERP